MTIEKFFDLLQQYRCCDYLVEVHYKYAWEEEYIISNEVLLFNNDHYEWLNDWNEGQHCVKIVKFIPIDDIEIEGVCYG